MEHHERAIERFTRRSALDDSVVGVVVVGSVARGVERPDSDVDAYLVVSEEAHARARADECLSYVTSEDTDYEGGYVDVKVTSAPELRRAVESADEPARASFVGARVTWSRDDEVAQLVTQIPHLDDAEFDRRARSLVAQVRLHGFYFLPHGHEHGDPFLLHHAGVHMTMAYGRALLAHNRRLYQGAKYLLASVAALDDRPPDAAELMSALLASPSPDTANNLMTSLELFHDWGLGIDETLSTFVEDNELAWSTGTLPPEFR